MEKAMKMMKKDTKQWKLMKNRGKTMKHDEKERKNTMKNDEKWRSTNEKLWKREKKQWTMMKKKGENNEQ